MAIAQQIAWHKPHHQKTNPNLQSGACNYHPANRLGIRTVEEKEHETQYQKNSAEENERNAHNLAKNGNHLTHEIAWWSW